MAESSWVTLKTGRMVGWVPAVSESESSSPWSSRERFIFLCVVSLIGAVEFTFF